MNIERLNTCESRLCQLAINDTTGGTDINIPKDFGESVAEYLSHLINFPFINVSNKFDELKTYNIMVELSGAINTLAVCLMKIANDIRLLGSRPCSDIGKLILFENEPGSSIVPDEVNAIQCEAMTMVAAQVMTNHVAVTVAVSMGHFELNVFKPLIIKNILHSIHILSDVCYSFTDHFINGIKLITRVSTTCVRELPIDNSTLDNKKDIEDNLVQRNNLSTAPSSLTRPTTSKEGDGLGPNGKSFPSRMESFIVPHLCKAGQPEKFIPDSLSSSVNQKIFGNIGEAQLTAPTTQIDDNEYYMEGEELIITRVINPTHNILGPSPSLRPNFNQHNQNYLMPPPPPPPSQQQLQQQTEQQLIKNLAEQLKSYLPHT